MRRANPTALLAGWILSLVAGACDRTPAGGGAKTPAAPSLAPDAASAAVAARRPVGGEAASPAPVPTADAGAAAATAAVSIGSFDCFKRQDDIAPGEIPPGSGIGTWQGGGPAGANWNAWDLVCAAAIRTTCTDGEILLELRVGQALLANQRQTIRNGGVDWNVPLPAKKWRKHLDEVQSAKGALFRTAAFRLTALLSCRAPYELQPALGPRREFAVDRMFVAGFAEGE